MDKIYIIYILQTAAHDKFETKVKELSPQFWAKREREREREEERCSF